MMRFPITDLLDERACFESLLDALHGGALTCPEGHLLPPDQVPHGYGQRISVPKFQCKQCGKVFNIFTGTVWCGTHYDCRTIILVLRGFAQGTPTLHLAKELGLDFGTLLDRRHRIQALALQNKPTEPLSDEQTEADEMFQNAGEKGIPHLDPDDPPRRRANKFRGKGTADNDRPPVLGIVGRTSGQIRLTVCDDTKQQTIQPEVEKGTSLGATLFTDECAAYNRVDATGRGHAAVCHSKREWARDDDGDGVREVHCNTMEGTWTGLRNFLRPFRGISKRYLSQYVAMFEWAHNLKDVTMEFLRAMMTTTLTYLPI